MSMLDHIEKGIESRDLETGLRARLEIAQMNAEVKEGHI